MKELLAKYDEYLLWKVKNRANGRYYYYFPNGSETFKGFMTWLEDYGLKEESNE